MQMPNVVARAVTRTLTAALVFFCAGAALGQDFPSKTVRIFAPPAGGGGDLAARIMAQGMAGPLGQPVIVDNRASILTHELGATAPPDGYTLLASGGGLLVYPLMNDKAPARVSDFAPITQITREVSVLVVHPSVPAKSLKELIALAKSRPGELNYSMVPSGNANQLAGELLKSMAGINIVSVPYKGSALTVTGVIGGEAQLTMIDPGVALPHVKAGKLRALAVTSAQPSRLAPGLPTIAASGLPGYEMVGQTSLYAPLKTPMPIIMRLNRDAVRVLNQPDVKEKFFASGVEPVGNSPEEFAAIIKVELAKAAKIVKEANLKAD